MNSIAKSYIHDLFQKQHSTSALVIDVIRTSGSNNDNAYLTQPFTKEEFKKAIFSMHPDKSPGPDGYNPGIYQHFLDLCSDNIFTELCNWLESGQFSVDLNMTNIALIPNGNSQAMMKDWRLISFYIK